MPGLIKIGTTTQDADQRLKQLYTTGVPVPFVCVYAIEPTRAADEVEKALHTAFGPYRENPDREFFRIEQTQIEAIMSCLGEDITDQFRTADDAELTAAAKRARDSIDERTRRPNFNLELMGIEPGTELQFIRDADVTVKVVDGRRVTMENDDEPTYLTRATMKALGVTYAVPPTRYWMVDGVPLNEIYEASLDHDR